MIRRFHAAAVILALLVSPLALLARSDGGQDCTMSCCRVPHSQSTKPKMACRNAGGTAASLAPCAAEQPPKFVLVASFMPAQLSAAAPIPLPRSTRKLFVASSAPAFEGFVPLPFEPPRA